MEVLNQFKGITEDTGLKILNTLESIDATLKRIEENRSIEIEHAFRNVLKKPNNRTIE